ncbi:MAG: cytochrome oxidase small assembly protein [Pseudomonadota bacterium]
MGPQSSNFRTALIMAFIALAFFIGVIIRHWLW